MVYLSVTISYPSTQFEELYEPFVNLGPHLPPKDNSPKKKNKKKKQITRFHLSILFSFNFLEIKRSKKA